MQLTALEFEKEWLKMVGQGYGYMKAFDMVNEWHRETFGHYRYSDYNSFRNVRDRK
jgi:hypothetical protein